MYVLLSQVVSSLTGSWRPAISRRARPRSWGSQLGVDLESMSEVMKQMISAIYYLHTNKICHRVEHSEWSSSN